MSSNKKIINLYLSNVDDLNKTHWILNKVFVLLNIRKIIPTKKREWFSEIISSKTSNKKDLIMT